LEEDLAYHSDGIRDHGKEYGLSAIDAVLKYGDAAADANAAAFWLCRRLGLEPTAMGWDAERKERTAAETQDRLRPNGRGKRTQADRLIEIATGEDVDHCLATLATP